MLKAGVKRRRTTQEINDQKEEEEIRQRSIEEKLARFEKLQQELNQARAEAENGKNAENGRNVENVENWMNVENGKSVENVEC